MAEEPEQQAREDDVDSRRPAHRPGNELYDDLVRHRQRADLPDDEGREDPDGAQRSLLPGMALAPAAVARNPGPEGDPRADDQEHHAEVEERVRLQRRVESVEHVGLAREDRPGGDQRADDHQGEADPGAEDGHAPIEALADHGIAEGDGEEGGEDDRVDHAVRGQALVVVDPEEADVLDDARAVQDLHNAVVDAEDHQGERQEQLDQDHRAQILLDHGVTSMNPYMSWWPAPQNSWQTTWYFPGFVNRACA